MGLLGALLGGGAGETVSPVVTILSPAAGGPLAPRGAIKFRIGDETGLRRAMPMIRWLDAETNKYKYEVIHDGDDFTADYFGSREVFTDGDIIGYEFIVRRKSGWPRVIVAGEAIITLVPFAWDTSGNEPT